MALQEALENLSLAQQRGRSQHKQPMGHLARNHQALFKKRTYVVQAIGHG
jgi:hypothetical protein